MERLTNAEVRVDASVDGMIGPLVDLTNLKPKLLNMILNGPTLNGVSKDTLRQIIRQLYSELAAYEDTGLEPEEVDKLAKDWNDLCTIVGECGGIDALRELAEAQERTRWIPVTERLPEDPVKKYIVFVPHPHGNIVDVGRYLGADGWVLEGWYLTQSSVTHWMPLPEPPKEAEKALEATE